MTTRTALVTGGSRGIGLGIVRSLLADRVAVAVNGARAAEEVAPVIDELAQSGEVTYVRGDVSAAADRERIVATAIEVFGAIDVLVNNAGITSPGRKDMLEADPGDFDAVMGVNLKGPFLLTQAVASHMIESETEHGGRRSIINISSISAELASTNRAEYCMSKAGLSMSTKLWAARLAEYDIDVYEVRPGIIATDMTAGVKEKYDRLIADGLTLEQRWGTPDDVGAAVASLVRGDLPYATGQVIAVDGGLMLPRL